MRSFVAATGKGKVDAPGECRNSVGTKPGPRKECDSPGAFRQETLAFQLVILKFVSRHDPPRRSPFRGMAHGFASGAVTRTATLLRGMQREAAEQIDDILTRIRQNWGANRVTIRDRQPGRLYLSD